MLFSKRLRGLTSEERRKYDKCAYVHVAGGSGVLLTARFPAARRPQQLHNVTTALEAMQKAGLNLQVC